ncbi:MAG: hypothetical protein QOC70_1743 [Verrucomicrobiota bacterium]|jgi:hypothetical protein
MQVTQAKIRFTVSSASRSRAEHEKACTGRNFLFPLVHMEPDPGNKAADAIVGKKSVENADQCPRVAGVSQMPGSEVQGRGRVRKLVQDPYCLAFVFADLPDDGSNVAITCPVSGHTFYASVSERL